MGKDAPPPRKSRVYPVTGAPASVEQLSRHQLFTTQLVRRMRGSSEPVLARATDGNYYVVKFIENPQGRRILINEVIASVIFREMDVRVPEFSAIRVSEESLSQVSHADPWRTALDRGNVLSGTHFASRVAVDPLKTLIYDLIPGSLIHKVSNRSDFVRALVVDKWLNNLDHRQAVFFHERCLRVEMVDHGHTLGGPAWCFNDAALFGLHPERAVYDAVTSWADLEPHVCDVEGKSESLVALAVKHVPAEWYEDVPGELQKLVELAEKLMLRGRGTRRILQNLTDLPDICKVFRNWRTSSSH